MLTESAYDQEFGTCCHLSCVISVVTSVAGYNCKKDQIKKQRGFFFVSCLKENSMIDEEFRVRDKRK